MERPGFELVILMTQWVHVIYLTWRVIDQLSK